MAGAKPHATEGEGEAASARDHLRIDHVKLGESKREGRRVKEGNVGKGMEMIQEAGSRNQADVTWKSQDTPSHAIIVLML